jgi:hypothetical protein
MIPVRDRILSFPWCPDRLWNYSASNPEGTKSPSPVITRPKVKYGSCLCVVKCVTIRKVVISNLSHIFVALHLITGTDKPLYLHPLFVRVPERYHISHILRPSEIREKFLPNLLPLFVSVPERFDTSLTF